MPKSTRFYFPDINVWVALAYLGHQHHAIATAWFSQLSDSTIVFCRLTQLGFLRLITNPVVMQTEAKTQSEAWKVYDALTSDPRIAFFPESDPELTEENLRALTMSGQFAPQQWPDAYLASLAKAEGLTLVTFDRALSKSAGKAALLLK